MPDRQVCRRRDCATRSSATARRHSTPSCLRARSQHLYLYTLILQRVTPNRYRGESVDIYIFIYIFIFYLRPQSKLPVVKMARFHASSAARSAGLRVVVVTNRLSVLASRNLKRGSRLPGGEGKKRYETDNGTTGRAAGTGERWSSS